MKNLLSIITLLIFIFLIAASTANESKDTTSEKSDSKTLESVYQSVKNFVEEENYEKAKSVVEVLNVSQYTDTMYIDSISLVMDNYEKLLQDRYSDFFKSASTTKKVEDLTVKFRSISFNKNWSFDNHGTEYSYRTADRGKKHLTTKVAISSKTNNPLLPAIRAYSYDEERNRFKHLESLSYEFARWKDYGSYLGNYADYGNDFAKTETINFSCGGLVSDEEKNLGIILVIEKVPCFYRNEDKYKNPPVSYKPSSCDFPMIVDLYELTDKFFLIKTFNTNKIPSSIEFNK